MNIEMLTNYFSQYGLIVFFIIIFLEYLNVPGLAAGIVMPLAGVWAANEGIGFFTAIFISVIAGLLGSLVLYAIARIGGEIFLKKLINKFPSQEKTINNKLDYLRQKGSVGVFISKLIPMARTLIEIPAGVLKIDFMKYFCSAGLGIFVWNLIFVGSGYIFGEAVFQKLTFL
ncbi:DedA family protein [Clostridium paraputrificum]|uniref:DedA family protein n=1 Tax=Clostridium paraputrificum TaxID=29363 RepID=UPI0018A8E25D|nr:DedA family protein [Clostridium paraputrificum]MDB2098473.1 DedA family protein [Clostridium paraputrificum]